MVFTSILYPSPLQGQWSPSSEAAGRDRRKWAHQRITLGRTWRGEATWASGLGRGTAIPQKLSDPPRHSLFSFPPHPSTAKAEDAGLSENGSYGLSSYLPTTVVPALQARAPRCSGSPSGPQYLPPQRSPRRLLVPHIQGSHLPWRPVARSAVPPPRLRPPHGTSLLGDTVASHKRPLLIPCDSAVLGRPHLPPVFPGAEFKEHVKHHGAASSVGRSSTPPGQSKFLLLSGGSPSSPAGSTPLSTPALRAQVHGCSPGPHPCGPHQVVLWCGCVPSPLHLWKTAVGEISPTTGCSGSKSKQVTSAWRTEGRDNMCFLHRGPWKTLQVLPRCV